MGIGIGAYFALPDEPSLIYSATAAVFLLLTAFLTRRKATFYFVIPALLIAMGFTSVTLKTSLSETKILGFRLGKAVITGIVSDTQFLEKSLRVTIHNPQIEYSRYINTDSTPEEHTRRPREARESGSGGESPLKQEPTLENLDAEKTPLNVRVNLKGEQPEVSVGDKIKVNATLFPPPMAAYPDSYDPGIQTYFASIGAVGYSMGHAEILAASSHGGIKGYFANLRRVITKRITEGISYPESTIAAALITGEQRMVPEEINQDYRAAGTYHILSISGFHIGLIAALSFWFIRLVLAIVPALAIKNQIKKWAAGLSLLVTFAYLIISGSEIPAVRSFIMDAFIMFAVMIDRKAISARNICWAATLILLVEPQSLLSPSFQLSFAATFALIAFYEELAPKLAIKFAEAGVIKKFFYYFLGIIITGFVAGLVTTPIVIYHFNQINSYSIIGNLIAEPISSFIVMPAAAITVILMPFGIEMPFMKIVEIGTRWMNESAHFIGTFPGGNLKVMGFMTAGLVSLVLGGLWFLIWQSRMRFLGVLFIALGMLTTYMIKIPDVVVDRDSALIKLDERRYMLLGKQKGFSTKIWKQYFAIEDNMLIEEPEVNEPSIHCDTTSCLLERNNTKTSIITDSKNYKPCDECNLSISLDRGFDRAFGSQTRTIFNIDLIRNGTNTIFIDNGVYRLTTVKNMRGNRPWNRF